MIQSEETRRLLDLQKTAVLIFDGDLRLCAINSAGEDLLASSARAVTGQTLTELFSDFPLLARLRQSLRTGQSFIERDVSLRCASGQTVKVDCAVTPINDELIHGRVLMEIDDVHRHQRILQEEYLNAQRSATNALIRGIAHEIKNPLGGIRGAAQLLERELKREEHKEYTRIVISEVDRLRNLLDRMAGPNNLPQPRKINVHEVTEHVRDLLEAEAPIGVVVKRDYDPSLPDLMADGEQLIQALLNIARNALQAVGDRGSILIRTRHERQICIGGKRHRLMVRVDVVDDGPGIPEELKDTIFFPMITSRAEGTGMGLPIAQSLIHRSGGLIEFVSVPGETIFTIWLPVEKDA